MSGLDSIALAVAHLERVQGDTESALKASTRSSSDSSLPVDTASSVSDEMALKSSSGIPQTSGFGQSSRVISADTSSLRPEAEKQIADRQPSSFSFIGQANVGAPRRLPFELPSEDDLKKGHDQPCPTTLFSSVTRPTLNMERVEKKVRSAVKLPTAILPGSSEHGLENNHLELSGNRRNPSGQITLAPTSAASVPSLARRTGSNHKPVKNLDTVFEPSDFNSPGAPSAPSLEETFFQVLDDDVLCGRGGETNHHLGNIQYRLLVKACQPAYLAAKRRDKPRIAAGIVLAVRKVGGRFLKKDAQNAWRDVGNHRAREKTSQALREGAPELRTAGAAMSSATKAELPSAVSPPPPPVAPMPAGEDPQLIRGGRGNPKLIPTHNAPLLLLPKTHCSSESQQSRLPTNSGAYSDIMRGPPGSPSKAPVPHIIDAALVMNNLLAANKSPQLKDQPPHKKHKVTCSLGKLAELASQCTVPCTTTTTTTSATPLPSTTVASVSSGDEDETSEGAIERNNSPRLDLLKRRFSDFQPEQHYPSPTPSSS